MRDSPHSLFKRWWRAFGVRATQSGGSCNRSDRLAKFVAMRRATPLVNHLVAERRPGLVFDERARMRPGRLHSLAAGSFLALLLGALLRRVVGGDALPTGRLTNGTLNGSAPCEDGSIARDYVRSLLRSG